MAIRKRVKKKKSLKISSWILSVSTTKNNTIVTLTDEQGNKIYGGGTGTMGFKWAKKNTPYAAEVLAKQVLQDGISLWLKNIGIIFKGTGMARDGIFKAVNSLADVDIQYITEATPIQFGWVKRKRPKRN